MGETDLVIALLAKDGASKVLEGVAGKIGGLGSAAKLALAGVAALTGVVGGALAGLTALANKSASAALGVAKLQRETGLSATAASKLSYAANRLGIDNDALSKSFGILSKSIDSSHPSLEKHNIDIVKAKDGHVDLNATLGNIAERFQSMPDGVEKTALALDIFGKSGKDMIPLLNKGRDGLKELGDEAARMGLVFDDKAIGAAKRLMNAHKDLDDRIEGLKNRIGVAFLPVLADWSGGLVILADKILPPVSAGLDKLNGFVHTAVQVFGDMKAAVDFKQVGGGDALGALIGPKNAANFMQLVSNISAEWQTLWIFHIRPDLEWAQENVPKIWDAIKSAIENAWKAAKPHLEELVDKLQDMKAKFDALPDPVKKWALETTIAVAAVKVTGLDSVISNWAQAMAAAASTAGGLTGALIAMGATAAVAVGTILILAAAIGAVIYVGTHLDDLEQAWIALVGIFKLLFAQLADSATLIFDIILGTIVGFINGAIDKVNVFIRVLNLIPGLNIPLISHIQVELPNADNVRHTLEDLARDRTTHIAVQYTAGQGMGPGLAAYAEGTPYVPFTGPAIIHKGEAVIPADRNPYAGGGLGGMVTITVPVVVDGREVARATRSVDLHESRRRGTTFEPRTST